MRQGFLNAILLAGAVCMSVSGCASLGPRTISPDRVEYIQEISESWKKQMLLNIVKLRYFDPPTFLDVSSIINQYGIENQVNADVRWYWPMPSSSGREAGMGGYSRYSDKPTITYTPLAGQKFTKSLLTPIPPGAVISLVQSGWAIDMVFSFAVKSINGVKNGSVGRAPGSNNVDFQRLVDALRSVQLAGVSDIRVEKIDDQEMIVYVISDTDNKEMYRAQTETIRGLLKIKPESGHYKIVFGSLPKDDGEIALLTRSMLEIMMEMAATVEVPPEHVAEKRVMETASSTSDKWSTKIHSGKDKPQDTFTAIQYQGQWFWIDNKDINSKRTFALLMIFLSLTETEQKSNAPVLTIGG